MQGSAGESIAVPGPRNAIRLRNVLRLDFGASRDFRLGGTLLEFFAEIVNLTDRNNPCCLVYDPVTAADGSPTLLPGEQGQIGVTGNIGLLWQF